LISTKAEAVYWGTIEKMNVAPNARKKAIDQAITQIPRRSTRTISRMSSGPKLMEEGAAGLLTSSGAMGMGFLPNMIAMLILHSCRPTL
jgi:hypothetical protein